MGWFSPNNWLENSMGTWWGQIPQDIDAASLAYQQQANPYWAMMMDPAREYSQQLMWNFPGLMQQGQDITGGMTDLYRDAGGLYMTPEMQQYADTLAGYSGGMGQYSDLAGQGFAGGGWTPQYQQAFDQFSPYMQGFGNNAQMALGDVGPNLIGQRGQTPQTQGLQDRMMDAANTGGRNAWLDNAMNTATQTLGNQGYNPTSQAMAGMGMGMAGQNPLLSMEDTVKFAKEQATQNIKGQAEKMYRNALARGGGPGAVTGAGSSNQVLKDFADEAAQLQTSAVRQALLDRQGLGLQQQGIGAGLMGQAEQAAGNRTGQAYSAIPGTQSAATNFLEAMLSGGLGAGNLENARMGTGANMSNMLLGNQLGYGNLFNATMGNQNQYGLGLGGLYNSMSGTQGNLMNQAFQNYLGSGQLGVNRAGSMAGAINSGYGNQLGAFNAGTGAWKIPTDAMTNLTNQQNQWRQSWLPVLSAPWQSAQYRPGAGQQSAASLIGAAAGAITPFIPGAGGSTGGSGGSGGGNP